jgi:hypothetical protein
MEEDPAHVCCHRKVCPTPVERTRCVRKQLDLFAEARLVDGLW